MISILLTKDTDNSSIETIYNKLEPPRQKKKFTTSLRSNWRNKRKKRSGISKKKKDPNRSQLGLLPIQQNLLYGDTVVEEEEFERVPNNADFSVPIIGDPMEPVIKNGQSVFVKEQPDVEDGEIAIVELDGDGVTCKGNI